MFLEALVDVALTGMCVGAEPLPISLAGEEEGPVLVVIVGGELRHAKDLKLAGLVQGLDVLLQAMDGATLGVWWLGLSGLIKENINCKGIDSCPNISIKPHLGQVRQNVD